VFWRKKKAPATRDYNGLYTWAPIDAPGVVRGKLVARQERTTAGCTIMPGEHLSYPTLLLLQIGDLLAPLKWLTDEAALRDQRITEAPLLVEADAARLGKLDGDVSLYAVPGPMYMTGTIVGITIWGLHVRPA